MSDTAVLLSGETDLDGFRGHARLLLARHIPPDVVTWAVSGVADPPPPAPPMPAAGPPVRVPPDFVKLCADVVLHHEPQRFTLMYRLLWRLAHEPGLRGDPLDPDMMRAHGMAQAVRRDMHKMKAFVRFRTVADQGPSDNPLAGLPLHVAWFEPEHHIVDAIAPWFAKRFTRMRWAILTPERSVDWDGQVLRFGPGARREDAPPPDAGEQLWLTYYQHIFNPARLKLKMMQKEMPRKYWHNLPEAGFIEPLAAAAHLRSSTMIEQPATEPARRIPGPVDRAHPEITLKHDGIRTFKSLKDATMRCRECPIGEHATQSVNGEGPAEPVLMFVGEQPGDQEDLRGQPFVGPAGQLLDRALERLGMPRGDIFVTNAVKHFKFELRGKRRIHKTPTQREAAACLHWLEDEIALARPRALVALGSTAARALTGRAVAVTSERGQWLERPDGRKVLITLHPSALLRMPPEEREEAFEAFVGDLSHARNLFHASR